MPSIRGRMPTPPRSDVGVRIAPLPGERTTVPRQPKPLNPNCPQAAALGARMRELRRAAGLSLAALADGTGGDRRRLGEIESGYAVPTEGLLARIDRILKARGQLTALLDGVIAEHHQDLRVAHASRRRHRVLQ